MRKRHRAPLPRQLARTLQVLHCMPPPLFSTPIHGGVGESTAAIRKLMFVHNFNVRIIIVHIVYLASTYLLAVRSQCNWLLQFVHEIQCLQLEQGMSYNATYFVEYMNTYADIMYAYGAWAVIRLVHARQQCVKQDLV